MKIQRKFDLLQDETRRVAVEKIISYFKENKNENIGIIAGEDILDFFLVEIGEEIYKKGIDEARKCIKNSFENLEVDLDQL